MISLHDYHILAVHAGKHQSNSIINVVNYELDTCIFTHISIGPTENATDFQAENLLFCLIFSLLIACSQEHIFDCRL